jgi:hypothetical protein
MSAIKSALGSNGVLSIAYGKRSSGRRVRPSMTVETATVQGRRKLTFRSFDEVLADAERLVSSPNTTTLGNWPLSQLLTHLTKGINGSIDGISGKAPWFLRLIGPIVKGRIIKNGMSPGFKLPKGREAESFPAAPSPQEALGKLRDAVGRLKQERMTARHPFFGKLTHEEWTRLHLRHAEMHLSFAVPG